MKSHATLCKIFFFSIVIDKTTKSQSAVEKYEHKRNVAWDY